MESDSRDVDAVDGNAAFAGIEEAEESKGECRFAWWGLVRCCKYSCSIARYKILS